MKGDADTAARATLLPPLAVLGMHRSGTSFLAGSLQEAGLELGPVSTSDRHNRKGNREDRALVAFHDRVLAARGHAWDAPPPGPVEWTDAERAEALGIVADRASAPWGFKDPRALLLIEGWRALFPGLRAVGIFRHPAAVAASLADRPALAPRDPHALWLAYNRRLLRLAGEGVPLLCFDEPPDALRARLDALLPRLGLRPGPAFWSGELRRHAEAGPLPREVRATYDALRAALC